MNTNQGSNYVHTAFPHWQFSLGPPNAAGCGLAWDAWLAYPCWRSSTKQWLICSDERQAQANECHIDLQSWQSLYSVLSVTENLWNPIVDNWQSVPVNLAKRELLTQAAKLELVLKPYIWYSLSLNFHHFKDYQNLIPVWGWFAIYNAEDHKPGSTGDCSCLSTAQQQFRINFPLTVFLQQHGSSLSINELSAKGQHLPQREGIDVRVGFDCLYLRKLCHAMGCWLRPWRLLC